MTFRTWSLASCAAASIAAAGVGNTGAAVTGFCSAAFANGVVKTIAVVEAGCADESPAAAVAAAEAIVAPKAADSGEGDCSNPRGDFPADDFGDGVRRDAGVWETGWAVLVGEVAVMVAVAAALAAAAAVVLRVLVVGMGGQWVQEGAAKGAPVKGSAAAPGLNETSTRKRSGASTG